MFPLDSAPSSFLGLLGKFHDMGHVKELVRHQLVAGVKAALSLVRLHARDVDLEEITAGPPPPLDDMTWDMRPHYSALAQYAEEIVDVFEEWTNVLLQHS